MVPATGFFFAVFTVVTNNSHRLSSTKGRVLGVHGCLFLKAALGARWECFHPIYR